MKTTNNVTLFSNGIGHFRRVYNVPHNKETAFSIPFKRDHIGDVAASLQVFGKVRLIKPPSFTPSNANATALTIDQSDAYNSLLQNLSGARVSILFNGCVERKFYTLLGIDTQTQVVNDITTNERFVVLGNGGTMIRRSLQEITDINFEDEGVRTEIEKALKNNFQQIKPDSTLLDLVLSSTAQSDEEAIVQYTIPVAAWKMRYAIRQEGDAFSIEGAAIIDNNTDEDWNNMVVSVVTGNPISFATDIASISVPRRKFVQLVDGTTLGNVDVESGTMESMCTSGSPMASLASKNASPSTRCRSLGMKMSTANYAGFGMDDAEEMHPINESNYLVAAESVGVDTKEVGDFSIFTSKEPITILARKSAVVPMFTVSLTKAGVVLLYKEANHARRPYRTVKFKNETEFSLGKGKTVIYNSGIFSGECVLDTAKPGENRMLPHCLENGVKVVKESKPVESKCSSINLSEGVGIVEHQYTGVTTYIIENKKDEPFNMALEHVHLLNTDNAKVEIDFSGAEIKEREKLIDGDGYRVYFELAAKQLITLTVIESSLVSQKTTIGRHFDWVRVNIIETKSPLSKDKQILAVIKAQTAIDQAKSEITEAQDKITELTTQADRIRKNIGAVGKDSGQNTTFATWVSDLDDTEKEIRKVNKDQLPQLNKKLKELQINLVDEIKKVSAIWKAK